MMDVQSVFKKYDIDPNASVIRAVQKVGDRITDAPDPSAMSNQIIKQLGGKYVVGTVDATIIAKALMEQAIINKANYNPEAALVVAEGKLSIMKIKHPYMFVMKESEMEAVAKPVNDKKARALAIFEANRDKKPSDVAKLIQVELGITFANAYYYVSRVFK